MPATRRSAAAILVTTVALVTPLLTGATSGSAAGEPTRHDAAQTRAAAYAPAAQAAAPSRAFTKRAVTIPVRIGPKRGIACTIAADIYRPRGVDRRHRAPAILTTNGFGGAKDDSNQAGIGRGFAREGYVVLSYSGLGFGGSDCKIYLDAPVYDGVAGKQLVSVLAGTKKVFDATTGKGFFVPYVAKERPRDPRVGMIGGSYGGQIQYAIAMQDKRIDTLIPIITWSDLAYSLAPNNSTFKHGVTYRVPGVHKKQWTSFFFAVGISDGAAGSDVDPSRNAGCPNFTTRACRAKSQLDATGYPDKSTTLFARTASVERYIDRIKVPVLLVQGQKDTLFDLQEAVATFRGLRNRGVNARMIWQSWGHSFGGKPAPGEVNLQSDSIRDTYLGRRFLSWMNHYVRGNKDARVGKRFCYFRNWVDYDKHRGIAGRAVAKAYSCHDRYTGNNLSKTLYFTGDAALTRARSNVDRGSATYTNASITGTSYSETSALEGVTVNNPPRDGEGTFVAFTSRRLAAPANLVGMPRLRLHLDAPTVEQSQGSGPGGKLVLFAKIYDVGPKGRQRLHFRLISPVRVLNVNKPVSVQLPGVVQRFPKGHRIRVVIAASDLAYGGNQVTNPVTVTTGPAKPSLIRLPITTPLRFR